MYGSKIRKVSTCIPTVPNKTILATKQEFFFTNVAPVQSVTDIALLGFWLLLLPWMFISSIYFFIKFFFEYLYFSEYELRSRQSIRYLRNWGNEGGHPKCVQVYTGEEGYHTSCVRTHLHYRFSCFCLMVFCFICRNLTLPSFKKGLSLMAIFL